MTHPDPYGQRGGGAAPRSIPVHLASVEPGVDVGQAADGGPGVETIFRTVTLNANDPAQEIMGASDSRIIAWVMAIDADIYLADKQSDAANGHGAYIPCVIPAATKPSLNGPYPVRDHRTIYAAPVVTLTGAGTLRVSVTAVYRR